MQSVNDLYLLVGLGNPGSEYERTRHNLGFLVVRAFAKKMGCSFKKERRFKGELASFEVNGKKVLLLLPMTYMNLSGEAVGATLNYFKIPEKENHLLVVVDDIYLNFGTMRLRSQGSAGGHNGLKNIEQHLQTQSYARLRLGIGAKEVLSFPWKDYVLDPFNEEEQKALPEFVEKGASVCECWLNYGIAAAANEAAKIGVNHEKR